MREINETENGCGMFRVCEITDLIWINNFMATGKIFSICNDWIQRDSIQMIKGKYVEHSSPKSRRLSLSPGFDAMPRWSKEKYDVF